MAESVMMVVTRCTDPARDAEFNRWYDEIHIPDVLTVPHVVSARRYKLAGPPSKAEPEAQYLTIYTIDTDETKAVAKELGARVAQFTAAGRMIDCLQILSGVTFTALGEARHAAGASQPTLLHP